MNAFLWLCCMSIAMFLGSFIAGNIPLAFRLSEERLKILTAFGAGLLVGCALIIIIPEGVETVIESFKSAPGGMSEFSPPLFIGFPMVIGFGMMFLFEQLGFKHPPHTDAADRALLMPLNSPSSDDASDISPVPDSSTPHTSAVSVTLGLVIHALSDGIALGAATTTADGGMIVFFAIMLHKAPSAFGLTAYLLGEMLPNKAIRRHLLLFSVAAPVGAVLTYAALHNTIDPASSVRW
eukprot:CAMPEP_0184643682 /NCGR_PEP_ID=MMETSP0308-20130426/506_1 /TAXON_ID=38269 /ORGANISM="Gloeochaete witrockiana, Strain SAG 46.84" /LENGTH=236 /DNA_ID=CAMNT_0027071759 /DNA_START=93 /DNA_END=800 /DNA_ORIENTATION=+